MTEKKITVAHSLEARSAALFVQTASKFQSNIRLIVDNKSVNGKSIMGIISLGVLDGIKLLLTAEGSDEAEAVAELERFLLEM